MSKLRNIILLPSTYLGILNNLKKQKQFISKEVDPLLKEVELNNDGSLSDKDFIKIRKYYGLAVPAILGEAFSVLRRRELSDSERLAATCQGIITGIFDDFFDDGNLSQDYIDNMVSIPELISPQTSNEKLFIDFYLLVLSKALYPNDVKRLMLLVNKNQIESVEQEDPEISHKRIWEITKDKGGNSVLFYRAAMDNSPDKNETEAMFQLGSLMQYENDIFDVYKDYNDGIHTIPTSARLIDELRDIFQKQMELFIELSYKMSYPENQIRDFLDRIMPVINRGFVCLDSYKKLETLNSGSFNPEKYTRKQLICDMETPRNFLKTVFYQIDNEY